jgi:hypothetical protein
MINKNLLEATIDQVKEIVTVHDYSHPFCMTVDWVKLRDGAATIKKLISEIIG